MKQIQKKKKKKKRKRGGIRTHAHLSKEENTAAQNDMIM